MKTMVFFGAVLVYFGAVTGATVIDGEIQAGEYDALLAVQDTPTGFGNNLSELNAVYGTLLPDGTLELGITCNLEGNGNAIVFLFDTRPGGAAAEYLPGGYGRLGAFGGQWTDDWGTDINGTMDVNSPPGGGSVLDPGFNPDFAIAFNTANGGRHLNLVDMTVPNDPCQVNRDIWLGSTGTEAPAETWEYWRDEGTTYAGQITHAFLNWNIDGVYEWNWDEPPGLLGDPLSAVYGLELALSSELVNREPGYPIKLLIFITNGGGDWLSNQFLPGLGGEGNPGPAGDTEGEPLFDARLFPGNQYISLRPDCVVWYYDYVLFALKYNTDDPGAELTGDNMVDIDDLRYFAQQWLEPCPQGWPF